MGQTFFLRIFNSYIIQQLYSNFRHYAGFNKWEEMDLTLILIENEEKGDKMVGRKGSIRRRQY